MVLLTDATDWTELELRVEQIRVSRLKSFAGRPPHLRALIGALLLKATRDMTWREAEDLIRHYAPARYLCGLTETEWSPDHTTLHDFAVLLGEEGVRLVNEYAVQWAVDLSAASPQRSRATGFTASSSSTSGRSTGFWVPKWHFVDDFKNVMQARIARNRVPRPRGWRLLEMTGGKALFFSLALVVPALFHRWWVVLLFYAITAFVVGLTLSVVFQLAHCVEEADFPQLLPGTDQVPSAWAVHQVQTTVDFAPRNRLLTWYLGGLNFQIEHHLFPKICHVHYPRLSLIVQGVCAEFGVRYAAHDRLLGAVCSHWRWLRRMGRPTATPQSQASFFTTHQAETSL